MTQTRWLLRTIFVLVLIPRSALGSAVIVPDQIPTIQQALDLLVVDTVFVRTGVYPERPVVRSAVVLRGLVAVGEGAVGLPVIEGLWIDYSTGSPRNRGPVVIEELAFSRTVEIAIVTTPVAITFEGCRLDSGIVDSAPAKLGYTEVVHRCALGGASFLAGRTVAVRESQVRGSVDLRAEDVEVSGCTISDGDSHALRVTAEIDGVVQDNNVSDCGLGIVVQTGAAAIVTGNRVERVGGIAIAVACNGDLDVSRNVILSAGRGVTITSTGGGGAVTGNQIVSCAGTGLWVKSDYVTVDSNLVARCSGDGVVLGGEGNVIVHHNTSAMNGGVGLTLRSTDGLGALTNNIVAFNAGRGMFIVGNYLQPPRCNDVFGNGPGGDSGPDDLSIDPIFCDRDGNDLQLRADSPLLDSPACGRIGALGVGCRDSATTPPEIRFDLVGLSPNPSHGPIRVDFNLAFAAVVEIDLFDIQGRKVAALVHGLWGGGTHSSFWDGRSKGGTDRGIYLVRYRFPGGSKSRRIVRLR